MFKKKKKTERNYADELKITIMYQYTTETFRSSDKAMKMTKCNKQNSESTTVNILVLTGL